MEFHRQLRHESDQLATLEHTVHQLYNTLTQNDVLPPDILDIYANSFAEWDQQSSVVDVLTTLATNPSGIVWTRHADSYDCRIDQLLAELVAARIVRQTEARCSVHFVRVQPEDRAQVCQKLVADRYWTAESCHAITDSEYMCPVSEQDLMIELEGAFGGAVVKFDYDRLPAPPYMTTTKICVFTRYWLST